MPLPDWSRAHGEPPVCATIRQTPEDFRVTEILGFELSGDGEHDYLYVEKIGTNTEWLSRQLADFAGVPAKDVGYSGLKDRHAITRQWFSVPRWNQPDWTNFELENVQIIDLGRNARKLRRGAHRSNHFEIILRTELENRQALEERLSVIANVGVPNYFGEQRFGRQGANIDLANRWAAGQRMPRNKRSIAISVARSFMFNEQLAERIAAGTWNTFVPGDIANLDGTGSVFDVEMIDDELRSRCETLDIHPTGLLWGDGSLPAAAAGHEDWLHALTKNRVKPARRGLRLRVADLEWQLADSHVKVSFELTRGAFATSVLREFATTSVAA